jgi:hypothetical protein
MGSRSFSSGNVPSYAMLYRVFEIGFQRQIVGYNAPDQAMKHPIAEFAKNADLQFQSTKARQSMRCRR